MVICERCEKPIRFIAAASGDGIFTVDATPERLIGEKGRILTGYRVHNCPGTVEKTEEDQDVKSDNYRE